jgi:hypothetical protein
MKEPKRSDEKYWTGTNKFNEIEFADDLQGYISELEDKLCGISVEQIIKDIEFSADLAIKGSINIPKRELKRILEKHLKINLPFKE